MIIEIKNLSLQAIIGILPHERKQEQNIIVDSKIWYNCTLTREKDRYTNNRSIQDNTISGTEMPQYHNVSQQDFLDYTIVINHIKNMLIQNKYGLIEVALHEILHKSFVQFDKIYKMTLRITKPDIYQDCVVSVTQSRNRKQFENLQK
ncbi:dihydroneopterin aldolase [Helicobacter didelphidarum]|nr:dihydroneopterin aldolase [Helicobacter didelphidarum]